MKLTPHALAKLNRLRTAYMDALDSMVAVLFEEPVDLSRVQVNWQTGEVRLVDFEAPDVAE